MNLMTKPIIQLINKHCYINNYKLSTMVYVTDIKSAKNFAIEFLSPHDISCNTKRTTYPL